MTRKAIHCDHFAYASAPVGGNEPYAYGITARSPGVDDRTLRQLDGYLYPVGVDQSKFVRSLSLLVLDGTVALTQARNAGYDGEGRPNSIYSHTVLIDKRDFEAIRCDTRAVTMQCPQAEQSGDLQPLEITPLDLGMDFDSARHLGLVGLRPFLESMFSGQSIAIRNAGDGALLQGLLSLLPDPLRLVPFTSLLPDTPRPHPFTLVQTDAPRPMFGSHTVINTAGMSTATPASTMLARCAGRLARMIADRDEEGIESLYGDIGALSGLGYKERLCAAAGSRMYSEGMLRSPAWAGSMARMLDAAPAGHASPCYGRLVRFLSDDDRARYSQRYGARLLTMKHAGRALDAAAFAEMLGECDGERWADAKGLVEALLEERPDDLLENGSQILSHVASHRAAQEVVDAFAASPRLRPLILDALSRMHSDDAWQYRSLFLMASKSLLAADSAHLKRLFAADACDLGSDDGARRFCRAASLALSDISMGSDVVALTDASEALHDRITSEISRAEGSYEERFRHLRGALTDAHDALIRKVYSALFRGAAGGEPAIQRAETAARSIAATIDRIRAHRLVSLMPSFR